MNRVSKFWWHVWLLAVLAAAALPGFAAEVAVLKNGFSIRHERREVVGDVTRLYITADGASYVDVATDDIDHYEDAPALPAEPTPSDPNAPAPRPKPPNPSPFSRSQSTAADLNQVINSASGRYRLDPDFISSVIKAESGFNVHAMSPKGAQGLMQLMPGTASQLGVPNPFDPEANVDGGTRYLRELLERYNFDMVKALAAYNAGPQRVEQFGGVPPFHETRAYVARIVTDFNKKKIAKGKATPTQKGGTSKTANTARAATKPHPKVPVTQASASPAPANQ